jgi:hypothetical protein
LVRDPAYRCAWVAVLGHRNDVAVVVAGCGFGVACLAVASIYQLRRYTANAAEETRRWTHR